MTCRHRHFRLRNCDPIGLAYCDDCKEVVDFVLATNNLLEDLQEMVDALDPNE